jgi:hypothetical protein
MTRPAEFIPFLLTCLLAGIVSLGGCTLLRHGAEDEALRKQVQTDSFPSAKQAGLTAK